MLRRSLLIVALSFCSLSPVGAQEADAPKAWDQPTTESQQSVADWAAGRFRAADTAAPEPGQTTAASNPLRELDAAAADKNPLREPLQRLRPQSRPVGAPATRGAPFEPAGKKGRYGEPAEPPAALHATASQEARDAFSAPAAPPASPVQAPEAQSPAPNTLPPMTSAPKRIRLATAEGASAAPKNTQPLALAKTRPSRAEPAILIPPEAMTEAPSASPAEQNWDPPVVRTKPAESRQPLHEPRVAPLQGLDDDAPAPSEGRGQPGPTTLEGPQSASLVVEKRGPQEARIGQPCRFVVRVQNTGQQTAEGVVLSDQTPAGTRLIATLPPADQQGDRLVWRLGSMAPGEQRDVEMRVEPLREGPIGSVAAVSFNATASAATRCTRPDLAMRVSAANRVHVGNRQTVRIELHNPGTGAASGVMLTSDLPDSLRHEAGPEIEYSVGTLAPGETRRIDLSLAAERADHVAAALTAVADGGLRAEQRVEFDIVAPSLGVALKGPKRRYLERPASYAVRVANPGTAPAKDVRLVTHLPQGMEFVRANNLGEYDAQNHAVYWSLAELPEGQSGEVELVAMPIAPGEHTLRVEGEARDGLKATESHRVTVEGVSSLSFEVRDLQDPVEVGAETTYEVIVKNEGTKAAANVRVRVEAPVGMPIASAQGDAPHRQAGAQTVEFAPIGRLEPGAEAEFRVRFRAQQAGDQRVTVAVSSDDHQRPIRREESTRVFGDE